MEKKKRRMPNSLVVLFILLIVVAILTYIIPAGQFARMVLDSGQEVADPQNFKFVERQPTGFFDFWNAIPKGFVKGSAVIAFTLIIAGTVEVIKKTGLIDGMVARLSNRLAGNGIWVIPILMFFFALIAAFIGTPELSLVYLPIIMPLVLSLGFNAMTAVGIVLVSTTCIGFSSGFTNPFTVGISHQITGLPMFSGMGYRVLVFAVFYVISVVYLMRYAKKHQRDPQEVLAEARSRGIIEEHEGNFVPGQAVAFTSRQKLIALYVVLAFVFMVYQVLVSGWGMTEMAGIFIMIGVLSGALGGMNSSQIIDAFIQGAVSVLSGCILIAVANGVSVLMDQAQILDTIVYYFGNGLQGLPVYLSAIAIFAFITLFNFPVPSGSGKAIVTMPIISPLARLVGLNQQVAVLAYMLGDGLTNILYPTSGFFMATIANAKVEYSDWVKFYTPLLTILVAVSVVLICLAQFIGYGPF
ncbi:YfcC family protein [Hutsoniella sourekii]|uniref:YfcC family protein n=1 Tax=Hutsoniella sourekii TaxID=87650 RepID=UPI0004BA082A|nr:YfcC family protein [Hutsoniella sourekii]